MEGINVLKKEIKKLVLDQRQIKYIFQKPMEIVYSIWIKERDEGDANMNYTKFSFFFPFCVGRLLNQESGKNRKEKKQTYP